jgi:hypothetical protein
MFRLTYCRYYLLIMFCHYFCRYTIWKQLFTIFQVYYRFSEPKWPKAIFIHKTIYLLFISVSYYLKPTAICFIFLAIYLTYYFVMMSYGSSMFYILYLYSASYMLII